MQGGVGLRFWSVVNKSGGWGFVHDFYPEEELYSRKEVENRRTKIYGTFDNWEEANQMVKDILERKL